MFLLLQISQVSSLRYDWWRVLLWLLAMSIPLVAVIVLWPSHKPGGLGVITNVLSAGLVIAVGQQLLASYYAPIRRGDSVSVTTQLLPSEQRNVSAPPPRHRRVERETLHGIVSVQNSGDAKLVLLGGIYTVSGYKIGQPIKLDWKEIVKQRAWERYHGSSPPTLVAEGLIYDPGTNWIASGVNLKADFLVDVPKNTFDRYRISVLLMTARGDKIRLAPTKTPSNQGLPGGYRVIPASNGGGVSFDAPIAETSWVNTLIRGKRRLYVGYQNVGSSPAPRAWVCIESKRMQPSDCGKLQEKPWNFFYGVNLLGAWSWLNRS
ncbi:MAG: hypothetical protein ACM3ZF_11395 [Mycobacterium leprae]